MKNTREVTRRRRKKMKGDQDAFLDQDIVGKKESETQDVPDIVRKKENETQDAPDIVRKKETQGVLEKKRSEKMIPTVVVVHHGEKKAERNKEHVDRMVWKKLSAVQGLWRTSLALHVQISTTHVQVASAMLTV
jgi:hypothetical protein